MDYKQADLTAKPDFAFDLFVTSIRRELIYSYAFDLFQDDHEAALQKAVELSALPVEEQVNYLKNANYIKTMFSEYVFKKIGLSPGETIQRLSGSKSENKQRVINPERIPSGFFKVHQVRFVIGESGWPLHAFIWGQEYLGKNMARLGHIKQLGRSDEFLAPDQGILANQEIFDWLARAGS